MNSWYIWTSITSFNTWHKQIKIQLGIPKPSVDEFGEVVPDGVINDEYTKPVIVAKNDVRALVQEQYSEGLTPSESPYIREAIPE